MRRSCIGLLVAVAVIVGAAPGLADSFGLHDRNDAYGKLDVKRMEHGHTTSHGRRRLMHRVETYGPWTKSSLEQDGSFFRLLFTTDADNAPERALVVEVHDGRWVAAMHAWRRGKVRDRVCGYGHIKRPNHRTVVLVFRGALLGNNVDEYGWHVSTQFHQAGHPHCGTKNGTVLVCPDDAPDDTQPYAYLRHQL